jgi:hypothetical protein
VQGGRKPRLAPTDVERQPLGCLTVCLHFHLLPPAQAADDAEAGGLSCGCSSPDKCTCPKAGTPAGDVAKLLCGPAAHAALPASGAQRPGEQAACPFTGLSLSQIAELKKTPPEVLQQSWKGIVQRLE